MDTMESAGILPARTLRMELGSLKLIVQGFMPTLMGWVEQELTFCGNQQILDIFESH